MNPQQADELTHVGDHIREAFKPWNPRDLTFYLTHNLPHGDATVEIVWGIMPNNPMVIPIDRDMMINYPESLSMYVAQQAANHFKWTRITEPESHIELGEN